MGGLISEAPSDSSSRGAAAALVAALAATGLSAFAALPEPPARRPGFTGAAGTVVQFQEASGDRILYREEMGGMILPVSPAVSGSGRPALPAPEPRPASASGRPAAGAPPVARSPAALR